LEILDTKAQNNLKVAEFAVRDRYFDAAVSRYYYYIYLRILIVLNKKGIKPNNTGGLSHSKVIGRFLKMCKDEGLYFDDYNSKSLNKLWGLKTKRTNSEYRDNEIILSEAQFHKIFFRDFNEVVAVLKKIGFIGG
jgi:uncharacterized protein (UPF0332 family)